MITKWYFRVKAKSKGYVKNFDYYGNARFTKQAALTRFSFDSEDDAIKEKTRLMKMAKNEISKKSERLRKTEEQRNNWHSYTDDERNSIVVDGSLSFRYGVNGWHLRHSIKGNLVDERERLQIKNDVDWDRTIANLKTELENSEKHLDFLENKLLICEDDYEIKFMDSHRREITWVDRDSNDTSGNYCCGCGGAVPGVPMLVIGATRKQRYRDDTHMCVICVSKLAEESKPMFKRVDKDIMEQYQTDRFMRSM